MKIQRTEKEGCALFKIEGAVTIENAEEFYGQILDGLNSSNGVLLDLSKVTDCDIAALQIFYSAFFSAKEDDKIFKVLSVSKAAEKIFGNAGFSREYYRLKSMEN